jgi:D-aminopeptidase
MFAGTHRLNGNGEMTGLEWVRESGMLTTPVALTNTHSVGAGTGMICHGFKGGIGTASRVRDESEGGHTVGVLVLANHGQRERLAVNGVPVGRALDDVPLPNDPSGAGGARSTGAGPGAGSIIVIVATDEPLLPHQCARLAQRAGLGVARVGGLGEHTSGDLFLCFATGNRGMTPGALDEQARPAFLLEMLADAHITGLFEAVVEATEEAIVNAMLGATTTEGRDGVVVHALAGERLVKALAQPAR